MFLQRRKEAKWDNYSARKKRAQIKHNYMSKNPQDEMRDFFLEKEERKSKREGKRRLGMVILGVKVSIWGEFKFDL